MSDPAPAFKLEADPDTALTDLAADIADAADTGAVDGLAGIRLNRNGDVVPFCSVPDDYAEQAAASLELLAEQLRSRRRGPPAYIAAPPHRLSRQPQLTGTPHYS